MRVFFCENATVLFYSEGAAIMVSLTVHVQKPDTMDGSCW